MSDLISREAVIELIRSSYPSAPIMRMNKERWEKKYKPYIETEKAVEMLPSAETEIIRCKDCKHRKVNEHYGEKGYMNLKAICELDTGDIFQLGRYAEEDDWFCADAERREGDADAD